MRRCRAAELGLTQQHYCCWFKKLVVSVVCEMVHGLRLRSVFYVLQYRPLKWICHSQHLGKEVRSGGSQLIDKIIFLPKNILPTNYLNSSNSVEEPIAYRISFNISDFFLPQKMKFI